MARSDTRFREAYNAILDATEAMSPGEGLPSETALAARLGVSRTIVRAALKRMAGEGLILWRGREKTLLRPVGETDRLSMRAAPRGHGELEAAFLDWILRFDVPAGTALNIAQLSRDFSVAPGLLKEFLAGLSRYGLVVRQPRGGWLLRGFTADFAVELLEFRMMLELNAVTRLVASPADHPVWDELSALRAAHLDLETRIEADFRDFSKLDEAFHSAINAVVENRFVAESRKAVSLIFHYHYMWDKRDEEARNAAAIREHLAIIAALEERDEEKALAATRRHLTTAATTLLSSLRDHRHA